MAAPRVFVSHASADQPLVEVFVALLEAGIGVAHTDIFCSTTPGQGIRPGVDFKQELARRIEGATCAIALVSENFYASPFCWCEIGAIWIKALLFFPILIPPTKLTDLRGVLGGTQVLRADQADDLDTLRDLIIQDLGIAPRPTPQWNRRRTEFIDKLATILETIPNEAPVPRRRHDAKMKELRELQSALAARDAEIDRLEKLNADISKLKDAKAVARVKRKHVDAFEAFDELVESAVRALAQLPGVVNEALYYRERGEPYIPDGDARGVWSNVERAQEYGMLRESDEGRGFWPDNNNAKVRRAADAIDALSRWLEENATPEFAEAYAAGNDDESPEVRLRSFWDRHLFSGR